jgi:hypothetical protein
VADLPHFGEPRVERGRDDCGLHSASAWPAPTSKGAPRKPLAALQSASLNHHLSPVGELPNVGRSRGALDADTNGVGLGHNAWIADIVSAAFLAATWWAPPTVLPRALRSASCGIESPLQWAICAPRVWSGGKVPAADLSPTAPVIACAGQKPERMRTQTGQLATFGRCHKTVGRGEPALGGGWSGWSIGQRCTRLANQGVGQHVIGNGAPYSLALSQCGISSYRQGKPYCIRLRVCEARSHLSCNWQFFHGGLVSKLRSTRTILDADIVSFPAAPAARISLRVKLDTNTHD